MANKSPTARGGAPGEPLQEIVLTAASPAADASATASRTVTQPGFVSFVAPAPNADGLNAALYGVVTLTRTRLGSQVITLWAGYIRKGIGGRPSLPGAPCENGDTLTLTVYGSTSWVGVGGAAPSVLVRVTEEQGQVLPVEIEAPGSGPGDFRNVAPADPTAGTDPAAITTGALTVTKLRGGGATFTPNDTTARRPYVGVTTGADVLVYAGFTPQVVNTAAARKMAFSYSDGQTDNVTPWGQPLPMYREAVPPGYKFILVANNIGAGEQWSTLDWLFEEWATP